MPHAVAEYAAHRAATDSWALGRFVVPLARWSELQAAIEARPRDDTLWPVSLLASPADVDQISGIMSDSRLDVQSVECKAGSSGAAANAVRLAALGLEVFVEPSTLSQFDRIAPSLARLRIAAKIRTGGVTADAFPSPIEVLAFLRTCLNMGIRFKATAGLHHAVRGEYRLTYETSSPMGEMFGFLNVAVASALLWHGRKSSTALQALEERAMSAFEFSDHGLVWRDEKLSRAELEEVRARFFAGFGCCSFREPMAEIEQNVQARP
jgi:hypothetical protein